MRYIVGFSGGVDSCFVAWKLKKLGHEVLLVNIKNTFEKNKCCRLPSELFQISKDLNIPLEIIDVTTEFKKLVIDEFIKSYLNGQTPNPCINCNELVRFKILEHIRVQKQFDKVTTGHYAKISNIKGQNYISIPFDTAKDQTYMLYRVSNVVDEKGYRLLGNVDFVLHDITKTKLKELYQNENIPISFVKESQNICFVPDDDYKSFIRQNSGFEIKKGKIVDKDGNYLGEHKGLIYYTIGQRHGLDIAKNGKFYVIKIDYKNNVLVVGAEEDLFTNSLNIINYFFHKGLDDIPGELFGKIRYRSKLEKILDIKIQGLQAFVMFENPLRGPTPGQHCVIYKKIGQEYVVYGGGVIQ